jgi:hypothetical protein
VPAGMQSVEVGNTINAKNDGLAIDHELLHPVLQRGFDNPGIALGPVVSIAGNKPHAVAVALNAQPVAVIFYFVKPVRTGGDPCSPSRNAKLERLKHAVKIGGRGGICESYKEDRQLRRSLLLVALGCSRIKRRAIVCGLAPPLSVVADRNGLETPTPVGPYPSPHHVAATIAGIIRRIPRVSAVAIPVRITPAAVGSSESKANAES